MIRASLFVLASCGPVTELGLVLGSEALHGHEAEIDAGAEALDAELLSAGVSSGAMAKLATARATLHVADGDRIQCGDVADAVGCSSWAFTATATFVWKGGCLSETAMLHELTHLVLCTEGDCDHAHAREDAWAATGRAKDRWLRGQLTRGECRI